MTEIERQTKLEADALPILINFMREQMKANPGMPLPALPGPGNLDIRQVISSPCFFA